MKQNKYDVGQVVYYICTDVLFKHLIGDRIEDGIIVKNVIRKVSLYSPLEYPYQTVIYDFSGGVQRYQGLVFETAVEAKRALLHAVNVFIQEDVNDNTR